jgi:hypothetical protein
MKTTHQRSISVSTVASTDKRLHRVYEPWPDYDHISRLVGYRIDRPLSKVLMPTTDSSRSRAGMKQRKPITSTRFNTAGKQIKTMLNLNVSSARSISSKVKRSTKHELPSILPEQVSVIVEPIQCQRVPSPQLPTFLCPSSMIYSQRIRTRQWLMKNNFTTYASRTVPLL